MITPDLGYAKRKNDFMAVLKFPSFTLLTNFFHERPKFLEQLSKYKSYIEEHPYTGYEDGCWLLISNNDFNYFSKHLGIVLMNLMNGAKVRNKKSGNTGIISSDEEKRYLVDHIQVQTSKGLTTWAIKNLEPVE
jgi:hypothetical protein